MNMQHRRNRGAAAAALIIGLLLYFVFKLFPVLNAFILSFQNYSPIRGMANSPWVGTAHFDSLLQTPVFGALGANSILLTILPAALALGIAFIAGIAVGRMPKSYRRSLFTALLLLPAFIPATSWGKMLINLSGMMTDAGNPPPLIVPASFAILFILASLIRSASIFSFVAAAAAGLTHDAGHRPARGAGIAILLMASLTLASVFTPDIALLQPLSNPLVYSIADVFDTYTLRMGLYNASYSQGAAVWVIKTLLQLIPAIAAAIICAFLYRHLLSKQSPSHTVAREHGSASGIIAAGIAAAVVLLFILFSLINGIGGFAILTQSTALGSAFAMSILSVVLALIPFALVCLLFVYAFYHHFGAGIIILAVLTAALSNNTVGEFLFYYSAGAINTLVPTIFSSAFIIPAFMLVAFLARLRAGNLRAGSASEDGTPTAMPGMLRAAAPYLVMLVLWFAVGVWSDAATPTLYVSNANLFTLPQIARNMLAGATPTSAAIAYKPEDLAALAGLTSLILYLPALLVGIGASFLYARMDQRA